MYDDHQLALVMAVDNLSKDEGDSTIIIPDDSDYGNSTTRSSD